MGTAQGLLGTGKLSHQGLPHRKQQLLLASLKFTMSYSCGHSLDRATVKGHVPCQTVWQGKSCVLVLRGTFIKHHIGTTTNYYYYLYFTF